MTTKTKNRPFKLGYIARYSQGACTLEYNLSGFTLRKEINYGNHLQERPDLLVKVLS